MKRIVIIATVIAVTCTTASVAVARSTNDHAHGDWGSAVKTSGGLDGRGGHHCRTRCKPQGLYTNQYHCHRSPCGRSDIRSHRAHGH